jgi:DNA-binding transcriptional LysR family regulator
LANAKNPSERVVFFNTPLASAFAAHHHEAEMSRLVFSRFANYLDEIARRGSIRKAAESLNISASAIDKQLIFAEQELDVALFERLPGGMRPTSAGEVLLLAIRNWRREFARVQTEINQLKGLRRGEVKIAVAQEAALDFVPSILAKFATQHPRITNGIRVIESDRVRQMVMDGSVDFGLTFSPQPLPGVAVTASLQFNVRAVVPASYPVGGRNKISAGELFQQSIIIPDVNTHLRDVLDIVAARIRMKLQPVMTTNSIELIKAMVRQGMGVGIVTVSEGLSPVETDGIRFLEIDGRNTPSFSLSLISSTQRRLSAAALLEYRHFELSMGEMGQRRIL